MATTPKSTTKPVKSYSSRLKRLYYDVLVGEMMTELKLKNVNQVPKLEKIVLNIGLGKAKDDKKMIEVATNTLRKITGQQPIQTFAKKSIASFKLREGNVIGLKVTLRGDRMYEFADRFINIVLPRLRDFHLLSTTPVSCCRYLRKRYLAKPQNGGFRTLFQNKK